jgi:hypothetical protein
LKSSEVKDEKELSWQGLTEVQSFWPKHYQACRTTDQSLAEYARKYGLAIKSFYYSKLRLRQLKAIEPEPRLPHPAFHPVKVQRTPIRASRSI